MTATGDGPHARTDHTPVDPADTNAAQAAVHAAELEAAIDDVHRVLEGLRRGLSGSRSSGYAARLRAQVNVRERELAELDRMRFELRRRFGV